MISSRSDLKGLHITVMGLGLHGGGIASADFLARSGAILTVTDLRSEQILEKSIERLKDYNIRYVLGRHEEDDFRNSDMIIKNPGVPGNSPYLAMCPQVETDISIFIRLTANPLYAVTGSKGKSTTVSALHAVYQANNLPSFLGGNITVSPLSFFEEAAANPDVPVILELSSWQLHDLPASLEFSPQISMITNIMKDHQNSYSSIHEYIADKELIYSGQSKKQIAIFNYDDPYTKQFKTECRAEHYYLSTSVLPENLKGAWETKRNSGLLRVNGGLEEIQLDNPNLPGKHNRRNMLQAALIAKIAGLNNAQIEKGLTAFRGIQHRLEKLTTYTEKKIEVYNDSAATIPDATAAALKSFPDSKDIVLITGGTDKEIDFNVVKEYASIPKYTIFLKGTASEKMIPYFKAAKASYSGPFDTLEKAIQTALEACSKSDILLFSPGATSFGMFLNEFDRGNKFKAFFV